MRRLIILLALPLAALLLLAAPAGGPVLAQERASAAADVQAPSPLARAAAWLMAEQRAWHRALVGHMRDLSGSDENGTGAVAAAWALILASFLYGLFHAAGPGHGKVVLATYLLTHPNKLRRGVSLAVASAFCQGAVAVVLIYGLLYLVDLMPRETRPAVNWTERASFVLLAALGLWLVLRALRDGFRLVTAGAGAPAGVGHSHHPAGHACDSACGHGHAPTGTQIERAGDLRGAIGVILSVGMRPCSGAILVLVLAHAMALPLAGIGAVVAMSIGTALAVACLALLAVHARRWAAALAGGRGSGRGAAFAGAAIRLGGGALILAFGILLFAASFAPSHPLAA